MHGTINIKCSIGLLHCTANYFGQTPHHKGVLPFNIECVRSISFLEYVREINIRQKNLIRHQVFYFYPTDAQLYCSKRMLKFTLKFTLNLD